MGGNCLAESLSLPHLLSLLSPPHTSLYTHFPFFPWNFLLYLSPTLFTALNLCKALYFSFNVLKIVLSIVYTPILLPFFPLRCQYYEHLLCVDFDILYFFPLVCPSQSTISIMWFLSATILPACRPRCTFFLFLILCRIFPLFLRFPRPRTECPGACVRPALSVWRHPSHKDRPTISHGDLPRQRKQGCAHGQRWQSHAVGAQSPHWQSCQS